jgi:tryptophan-rich sensory protein
MGEQERFEVRVPKGKLKAKHIGLIACFAIVLYLLTEVLNSVFSSGFSNPNYAIVVIALILVVITIIAVYTIRQFSKENHKS